MFEQTSEDDVTSRSMNHNEENNRLVVSYSWQGNTQYCNSFVCKFKAHYFLIIKFG